MMSGESLGQILRRQRRAKGLTLVVLAAQSGVSPSFLGRVEQGKRCPSARTLRKLAQPLNFNEVELFRLAGFLT